MTMGVDQMGSMFATRAGTDPEARPGPDAASARAIGVRFLDFDDDVPPERLLDGWTRVSLLH